ncbi:MAG: hypothetical protein KatS3mg035_1510 [Bacteroidia bacterium]|nr:MAG: hypothetical protein KatS3mg035_1510 [Bacteroidia bacterium]
MEVVFLITRGTIYISGNWKNDAGTTGFVGNNPTGNLVLDGADQRILGNRSTVFNNLTLTGYGSEIFGYGLC